MVRRGSSFWRASQRGLPTIHGSYCSSWKLDATTDIRASHWKAGARPKQLNILMVYARRFAKGLLANLLMTGRVCSGPLKCEALMNLMVAADNAHSRDNCSDKPREWVIHAPNGRASGTRKFGVNQVKIITSPLGVTPSTSRMARRACCLLHLVILSQLPKKDLVTLG